MSCGYETRPPDCKTFCSLAAACPTPFSWRFENGVSVRTRIVRGTFQIGVQLVDDDGLMLEVNASIIKPLNSLAEAHGLD